MNQRKPVFLKTYGRLNRKLNAWISPNNRRQIFESTPSSVSDDSIRESNVAKHIHRGVRQAKQKATEHLKEKDSDEEDVFIPPPLYSTQNKKRTRSAAEHTGTKQRAGRVLRKAQRVKVLRTSESESDSSSARNENTAPKRCKLNARCKKSSVAAPPLDRFVTNRRRAPTSKPKLSTATVNALMPLHSLNSSGDFVLGRGGSNVPRINPLSRRKAALLASIVSSTENSVSEMGDASSTTNPFLREISFVESVDHSLVTCPRKPLFCSTPHARPLGKWPHLKTLPTKHQPSASLSVSASNIVCLSTSQEELGSPVDPFSPPASAPLRELNSGEKQLSTLGEPQKESEEEESVDQVVVKRRNRSRRSSCSIGRKNQNEGTEIQNGHGGVSNESLFSLVCSDLPSNSMAREETEGSSHFVSAAGGLECLVEGLKEKCLTQQCTVKLERIKLTATQLHGQTTYSSCLDHTCSVHSRLTTDHTMSVDGGQIPDHSEVLISSQSIAHSQSLSGGQIINNSPFLDGKNSFHLVLEVDSVQTIDHSQTVDSSQSVINCDSIDHARSVTDDQFIEHSQSVDCYQSVDHTASQGLPNDQSKLVVSVESDHHIINSVELITDSGSVESSRFTHQPQFAGLSTEDRAASLTAMLKEKSLTKKPTVQMKRMTLSQLNITQQLKEITQSRESVLVSDGQSVNCTQSAEKSGVDHTVNRKCGSGDSEGKSPQGETKEILTIPTDVSQKRKASDTQLVDNSCSIELTDNNDRTEVLTATLMDYLRKKCTVQLKRMDLSEQTQRLKETTLPSSQHDLSSASDGQSVNSTWSGSESESDRTANADHPNGHRSSRNVDKKKVGLSDSDHKTTSETKEMVRIPCDVLPKGKKASLAPEGKRRRSVSRDRPGTTRKACVRGLSVSRWKDKGNTSTHTFQSQAALRRGNKAGDCSITELVSTHHNKPKVHMDSLLQRSAVIFSTPVRGSYLNLSSLLADITPSKHTWSRLKAALSVHRKTKAFITPKRFPPSVLDSPGGAGLIDVSQDLFTTPIRKLLPRSQLLQRTPLCVSVDDDLSDAEKVYAECGQEDLLSWEECILPQQMKQCKKIGEGTFGEVFSTTNASGITVALKIIPLEGGEKVNGEDQKTFGEILHEIIISKELSSLKDKQHNQTRGFIGLNDLHCVRGCYPPALLKAWDAFDRKKGSENDRPDFFEEDQLFLILEFEFGGSDLENSNGLLSSLIVAKSILHQVTAALAVAEQELCFEHRDLHWGNVLVKTTKEKKGSFLLNGSNHYLETKGVLVRMIDYSLSRLEIDGLTVSCDISEDEELFMGHGDYQFDIYRLMRQENGNNWADYQPHSNVLWLHYLSSKLLCMKYRGIGGRGIKDMREELTRFHDNVLQYRSATEALQNALLFKK